MMKCCMLTSQRLRLILNAMSKLSLKITAATTFWIGVALWFVITFTYYVLRP